LALQGQGALARNEHHFDGEQCCGVIGPGAFRQKQG
jgi:hypothetical protein